MLLAQITDTHIGASGAPLKPGRADTSANLTLAIGMLNSLEPQPDAVLLSGDIVKTGQAEEYAHAVDLLSDLSAPLFLIPGNHDNAAALRHAFAPLANTGAVHMASDQSMLHKMDGAFVIEDRRGGRALAMILLDSSEFDDIPGRLYAEQLNWLEERLAALEDQDIVIALHHPPLTTGVASFDKYPFAAQDRFQALIRAHASRKRLVRILCGHNHRPMISDIAGVPMIVCPATSYSFKIDLGPEALFGHDPVAPAFMLHHRVEEHWISHVMPLQI